MEKILFSTIDRGNSAISFIELISLQSVENKFHNLVTHVINTFFERYSSGNNDFFTSTRVKDSFYFIYSLSNIVCLFYKHASLFEYYNGFTRETSLPHIEKWKRLVNILLFILPLLKYKLAHFTNDKFVDRLVSCKDCVSTLIRFMCFVGGNSKCYSDITQFILGISLVRRSNESSKSFSRYLPLVIWALFKLVEHIVLSQRESLSSTKGMHTVVPPAAISNPYKGRCPLCNYHFKNPNDNIDVKKLSVTPGGIIFCSSCIRNYIACKSEVCPVTGWPCRVQDLVELHVD